MGKFIYNNTIRVDFEDRLLSHLQVVITTKLRRGESFTFAWKDDASMGNGRTMVWIYPTASLVFKFYGGRKPSLNAAWLEVLSAVANSNAGLYIVPEPALHPHRTDGDAGYPSTDGAV
jgi:hypothetical protein